MEATCKDNVFGEMTYRHRWYKKQTVLMFDRKWDITVAAKAYSGKPITEQEQDSYKYFMENEPAMIGIIGEQLKNYINQNLQDLSVHWIGARNISKISELAQIVTPKTLLFKQDGTTIMLLECVWDKDSGVAVKLTPEVKVGSQDLFL
ncbi:MAG: hypothetical protein NC395_01130 [Prevotella sp.]|nr:hypothetical protein [Prevotella sp.]